MNKKLLTKTLTIAIVVSVFAVVASNYAEQYAIDSSKLPEKVEESKEFQKWLINHKKRFDLDADEFRLVEKNELLNSAYLTIKSADNPEALKQHQELLERFMELDDVRFSPNEYEFLDYRRELREDEKYNINDVYYHGLREDRIIDAKILSCDLEKNCYFDRAFFLDNHTFVISQISRPLTDAEVEARDYVVCELDQECEYTIKLHVFDFINSAQFVYESQPYILNISELSQYF